MYPALQASEKALQEFIAYVLPQSQTEAVRELLQAVKAQSQINQQKLQADSGAQS